jgi:hypothetical protein
VIGGVIGGALLHPSPKVRGRGILVGGLGAPCCLLVTYAYVKWRFDLTGAIFQAEMLLPFLVGCLPAGILYWLLLRDETVEVA